MRHPSLRSTSLLLTAALLIALLISGCKTVQSETPDQRRERALGLLDEGAQKEKQADYKRAIELYQQALALSPRPRTFYALGHCYAETNDLNRSEGYLRHAIEMQPDYTVAKYELQRVQDLKAQSGVAQEAAAPAAQAAPAAPARKILLASQTAPAATPAVTPNVPEPTFGLISETATQEPAPTQKVETPSTTTKTLAPAAKKSTAKSRAAARRAARRKAASEATTQTKTSARKSSRTAKSKVATKRNGIKPTPTPEPTPVATATPTNNASEATETAKKAALAVAPVAQPTETAKPAGAAAPLPFPTPTPSADSQTNDAPDADAPQAEAAKPHGYDEIHQALFPDKKTDKKGKTDEGTSDQSAPAKATGIFKSDDEIVLDTFAYHFDMGKKFLEMKEFDKAVAEMNQAVQLDPKDIDARLGLGDAYAGKGRAQIALEQYEKALADHPKDPKSYVRIGSLYAAQNSPRSQAEAKKAYQKALQLDPNFKGAFYKLGVLAMTNKDTNEAIGYFEKVLSLDEKQANAHLNLGILYGDYKHDKANARAHYQRYIELGGSRSSEVKKWLAALDKK